MLRFLFPLVSLAVASLSIAIELFPRQADSRICLYGGCRYDQIFATRATPATAAALLNEASADPGIWCTYGEFFSARGEIAKATAAFDRALVLGPRVAPVLMRAANFDFTHGRTQEGLQLAGQILSQTDGFDQILFSYIGMSGEPVARLLGTAVPPTSRAALSWLAWVRSRGSDQDILDTWAWMRRNQLSDARSAADTASTLWHRRAYAPAQELWADWLGAGKGDYLSPQRLANTRFEPPLKGTPFDWSLSPGAGVELTRRDGLEVRFSGLENLTDVGVLQFTTVSQGRYRFSAEVRGDAITTNEGPFFLLTDAENPARLRVETEPVLGDRARAWISRDFTVPAGTLAIQVKLVRRSSLKFDNKIAGMLHIYQVSLVPASHGPLDPTDRPRF